MHENVGKLCLKPFRILVTTAAYRQNEETEKIYFIDINGQLFSVSNVVIVKRKLRKLYNRSALRSITEIGVQTIIRLCFGVRVTKEAQNDQLDNQYRTVDHQWKSVHHGHV